MRHPFHLALPPLPGSSRLACLNCPPPPGAWDELTAVDLRLQAWARSACLLPCRAALSLTLVRYSGAVRPAGSVAWLSSHRFCSVIALVRPRLARFVQQSHRVRPLPACPFRHLPRLPAPHLLEDVALLCSAFRSPYRLAICPRFPFPRSAPLPAGRGGAWCVR